MPTVGLIDKAIGRPQRAKGISALGRAGALAATRATGAITTSAVAYGIRTLEKASGMRFDPIPAYLFYVELSGVLVALFTECSGLEAKRAVETVEEGGVNDYAHHLPGRVTFSNIKLKRGLSLSRSLWDWCMQGRYDFRVKRFNFSIIQGAPGHNLATAIAGAAGVNPGDGWQKNLYTALGRGFGKVKHWDVEDAFPVKWELSDLKTSAGTEAAIETLEVAHHGLSLSYEVLTPMSLAAGAADLVLPTPTPPLASSAP
jgi:phage tail-like protein